MIKIMKYYKSCELDTIEISSLIDEDIVNYKKCSMFIGTPYCNFKCCKESNIPITVCQNHQLNNKRIVISIDKLIQRYLENPLTESIVFGGMEPFEDYYSLLKFIKILRDDYLCDDDVVIYTGFYPEELVDKLLELSKYNNIIIKYGRYIPNRSSRYDEVLGVSLSSDNQIAWKLS